MRTTWLILVMAAGCQDLPDLGTCGNGIIEATNGEACDGDLSGIDTCSDTCQLTCQTAAVTDAYVIVGADAPTAAGMMPTPLYCPDERMRCGLDHVCRAPSGQYASPGNVEPFDVKSGAVGDVDGDRVVDLIGTSATGIVVRFGNKTGGVFGDGFTQTAPSSEAPIVIFDRDPDTLPVEGLSNMALVVPTDGAALLTANAASFAPDLDLTLTLSPDERPFVVRDPGLVPDLGDVVMAVGLHPLTVKRPALLDVGLLALGTCGPADGKLIDVAVSPDRTAFVVAGESNNGNRWFACSYTHKGDGNWLVGPTPTFMEKPPSTVVLADIDGDACKELVFTRTGQVAGAPRTVIGFVKASGATCALETQTTLVLAPDNSGDQAGRVALFAAGQLVVEAAGPQRDELAVSNGVFAVSPAHKLVPVAKPTVDERPWTSATFVDLNGDGALDVVAGRAGQDDVDVVRGGPQVNVYRADTAFPVIRVASGDFDGDRLGDVALVEDDPFSGERLAILYGTASGFVGPAVANSTGDSSPLLIARLGPFRWGPTSRGDDGIDDLVVARNSMTPKGGVMIGDASRVLTMPRFPDRRVPSIGTTAVGSIDGVLSLISIHADDMGVDSELLIHNLTTGKYAPPVMLTGRLDTTVATQVLRTHAGPLVVGRAVSVANTTLLGVVPTTGGMTPCTISDNGRLGIFHPIDLDGDGVDELAYTTNAQVHVIEVTSTAMAECGVTKRLTGVVAGCTDVTVVSGQIIALCRRSDPMNPNTKLMGFQLTRIASDGTSKQRIVDVEGTGIQLVSGDFDGDGVPDLAVGLLRGQGAIQFIKQCPAHDVRGCQ